jgi:HEAT repeat protein
MFGRNTFESSVDLDRPIKLAYKKWPSTQYCWEAKDEVASAYKELEPDIQRELRKRLPESSRITGFAVFMVGRTSERAKPIIIIFSPDDDSRGAGKRAIKDSDLLTNTMFSLGTLRTHPAGHIEKTAMEDEAIAELPSFIPPYEVLFDPRERIRLVGMPIFIRHSTGLVRRATANVVYDGARFGYLTAAHAFEEITSMEQDMFEDDLDIPFDTGSEIDEDELTDEEKNMLSIHSDTSLETVKSEGQLLASPDTSRSRSPSPQTTLSHTSLIPFAHVQQSRQTEVSDESANDAAESPLTPNYKPLGTALAPVAALDYVVIVVKNSAVKSVLHNLCNGPESMGVGFTTKVIDIDSKPIIAWTSHGPQPGYLIATPMTICFSNSSYELVYKFTYHEAEAIRMGDCGTLVTDPEGSILYGHVVSTSKTIQTGYAMESSRTVQELERGGRWRILSIKDASVPAATVGSLGNQSSLPDNIIKAIAARLEGRNLSVRAAAVKALGQQSSLPENVLQAVAAHLENKNQYVRAAAVEALGQQSSLPENVLQAVAARLEDNDLSVQAAAVKALGQQSSLPENVLQAVAARLEDNDLSVQAAAVKALGQQSSLPENVLQAVAARLEDNDLSVRAAAVKALGQPSPLLESILQAVAARLEDNDLSVRAAAVKALGQQSSLPEIVLKTVVAYLEHKDSDVRAVAVKTLGKEILNENVLQAVAARLDDDDWFTRDAVVEALGKRPSLPDNIVEGVAALLEDDYRSVQFAALKTLGQQSSLPENVLQAVAARLEDNDLSVRTAAVEALGQQSLLLESILQAVAARLEDNDLSVQAAAVKALGQQ